MDQDQQDPAYLLVATTLQDPQQQEPRESNPTHPFASLQTERFVSRFAIC